MVKRVVWSHEATDDLEAIANYIARDSFFMPQHLLRKPLIQAVHLMCFMREVGSSRNLGIQIFVSFLCGNTGLFIALKNLELGY